MRYHNWGIFFILDYKRKNKFGYIIEIETI